MAANDPLGVCAQFFAVEIPGCTCEDKPQGGILTCEATLLSLTTKVETTYNVCVDPLSAKIVVTGPDGTSFASDSIEAGTDSAQIDIPTGLDIGLARLDLGVELVGTTPAAKLDVELVGIVPIINTRTEVDLFSIGPADYSASCSVNQAGYTCFGSFCIQTMYLGALVLVGLLCGAGVVYQKLNFARKMKNAKARIKKLEMPNSVNTGV